MVTKEWKFLSLIIVVFIAACIETDIYLPAFTDMMEYFSISERTVQSLLTYNFLGICLSGPLYGPISDSIGRKKPLMSALGLFLIGSLITLVADNFDLIILGRILQGLGSGGCFTLGTAIIFDVFQKEKAVLALNKLNVIIPLIMAGAPLLGAYLNQEYGFRSNFLAIALCVTFSFILCICLFDETLSKERRIPFHTKKILMDFRKVLGSLSFWQTTFIVSLIFSGYLAFLSTISVLFVLELGVTKQQLPFHQVALLGGWVVASLIFKKAINLFGIFKMKIIGTFLCILGGFGFAIAAWITSENVYLFTGAMVLYTLGANWINGIYFPEGMELFPDIKGITASLLTSARLLITALIVGMTSKFYDASIYPIATVIFGIVLAIMSIIILYERKRSRHLDVSAYAAISE